MLFCIVKRKEVIIMTHGKNIKMQEGSSREYRYTLENNRILAHIDTFKSNVAEKHIKVRYRQNAVHGIFTTIPAHGTTARKVFLENGYTSEACRDFGSLPNKILALNIKTK